jgi:hypothetical protein
MSTPENFKPIILDLVNDLTTTFPEFSELWKSWRTAEAPEFDTLFQYCLTVYPERFFDILYNNADIFGKDSVVNTMFLPSVDFKVLFNCDGVTENTKKTLWKYLQLILFNVVGSIDDKSKFGDAASMFDGIDEKVLQDKLKETMEGIGDLFKDNEFKFDATEGMPKADDIHEHLTGIFDGKIGKLAKELAEEISGDFADLVGDGTDGATTQDVIKKMMKNPKKMMDLVKTVSDKLTNKIDSGEITKEEIMKEASGIMDKMKDMGGGDKLQEMLKKFAGAMGKNARVDMSALDRMTKQEANKDRIRQKLEKRRAAAVMEQKSASEFVYKVPGQEGQQRSSAPPMSDEQLIAEFEKGTGASATATATSTKTNKKKKKTKK